MTPRNERERLEAVWREKLRVTEEAYNAAIDQTRQIQTELASMPPADGNLALAKALSVQNHTMNEYARVLQSFTRLILYGEMPDRVEAAPPRSPDDVDIQEWVFKRHDFVPHPAWIAHCRELYLGAPPQARSHDCPPEKRTAIKEAFVAFGMLTEPEGMGPP